MSVVGAEPVAGRSPRPTKVPVSDRFVSLLMLLGEINLFVGMFNFIPLLPLDEHIAGALYEAVRRGIAKLLRRPARLLRRGEAAAGGLRDGRCHPRDERGADLRRHRGAGPLG